MKVFQKKRPHRINPNVSDLELAPNGHPHGLTGWMQNGNRERTKVLFDEPLGSFLTESEFDGLRKRRAKANSEANSARRSWGSSEREPRYSSHGW